MARITMRNSQKATFAEVFEVYISAVTARGVKDKTLATYKQHFHAISKRLDVSLPINRLNSTALDNMILQMRKEGLSDSSINSYTRTLKCFLSWCNEEGYTKANLKIYKAAETVKETYTDEELLTLLAKPDADCKFCEYRNWVIVNFLLNSGCRAATVRNIQNQDVDLSRRQIVLRHTKNGKVQVIPLCSAMVSILRDYMAIREGESSDYLFCNEFGGFRKHHVHFIQVNVLLEHEHNAVDVLDVPINGAAFRRNTAVLQIADDVISGLCVVFIGVFHQILQHHIGLQLLVGLLAVLGNDLSLQAFVSFSSYFLVDNFISH